MVTDDFSVAIDSSGTKKLQCRLGSVGNSPSWKKTLQLQADIVATKARGPFAKKKARLRVPSMVFPKPGKLGFVVWNDPVEPERTRPLERRWPKERQERLVLLERLVQSEQRPQVLSLLLVLLVLLWLGLQALEEQWWSFRRFLH